MVTVRYLNDEQPTIFDPVHWAVTVKENMLIAIPLDGDESESRYTPLHRIASIVCDEGERLVPLDRDDPEHAERQLVMEEDRCLQVTVCCGTSPNQDHGPKGIGLVSA